MRIDAHCIECLIKRQASFAYRLSDNDKALDYMKKVMEELLSAGENITAPYLTSKFTKLFESYSGVADSYSEEKRLSNEYMLQRETKLRDIIQSSDKPLETALKLAAVGNYIDFGALAGKVSMYELDKLLESAKTMTLTGENIDDLVQELLTCHKLLYIGDNAGEIVADKLVIEEILRHRKDISITFAVRGEPIQNDATREDAEAVGMGSLARIVDSGTNIGGTVIDMISDEMRESIYDADLIIAKGQGNFETMNGCGLNVYYLFICKCVRFTDIFDVPKFTGILANEKRLPFEKIY